MVELIIVLLGIGLFYGFFVIPTKWLKVERVEVPLGINKKILQLSDLHVERNRIRLEQIRELLVREKPDYIFITGDFTAREKYIPRIKPFSDLFQGYGKVVYAVFGNHDYRTEALPHQLRSWLGENGVKVLINESIELYDFTLIGLDFYKEEDGDVEKAFKGVKNQKPKVVLSHDPNDFLRVEKPFDLMLSGHLHGKQFNVPFFFKIISKGKLARKGIYKGLHKFEGTHLYISKGMGQAHWNLRFGVRSEVTVLSLNGGKKNDEAVKT
ncbi:metallophosphoesterase [Metabacillus idriensis]|uniref:metallophosphoesterase n=1 Tax=Metabacillus idriensis TaxID=324768 RepID=UPI002812B190|nr:metallophosphoesterase [Metabacillus idriensis]MDR0138834.1 metallophosphoesterase [Metabacillus idriensis]